MISGDLCYVEKERHGELRGEIGDVERMLKVLIKSLESKHLDPWVTWQWLPVEMEGSLKSQSHPE